jgi:glutamine cyclotransferase
VRNLRRVRWFIAAAIAAAAIGFAAWAQYESRRVPEFSEAAIVAAYPHDPRAFTQGLAFHDGHLYEGTGRYGASSIRRVDLTTGVVEQIAPLNRAYFGEGIAILGNKLFQLTWQNQIAVIYDLETFEFLDTLRYAGEGWGLTHDGERLILSDGSSTIRFLDPDTFETIRQLDVRDRNGLPIERLNELEYVHEEIWANIWYQDRIARISPDTGIVAGWIDISNLYPLALRGREDVANGIAYDADAQRLFVTGKNWPQLFEIELTTPTND